MVNAAESGPVMSKSAVRSTKAIPANETTLSGVASSGAKPSGRMKGMAAKVGIRSGTRPSDWDVPVT